MRTAAGRARKIAELVARLERGETIAPRAQARQQDYVSIVFGGGLPMRRLAVVSLSALIALASPAAQQKERDRLEECGVVMEEILGIPDGIPRDLLDRAECVVVIPSMVKGAVGLGYSRGRGAMICRSGEAFDGPWGAPAMYGLDGGSIGFQLGGQATDVVLLVMNPRGAKALLGSRVKLGANASVAAGPKGRDAAAATDASMRAEILSYSRSRGLFAGVSLEGSSLRPDDAASEKVYGRPVKARGIIEGTGVVVPAPGRRLVGTLEKASPRNRSD
jgi:lipid-binding SYLF domain-containing protein